jgi:hypothetical protein
VVVSSAGTSAQQLKTCMLSDLPQLSRLPSPVLMLFVSSDKEVFDLSEKVCPIQTEEIL